MNHPLVHCEVNKQQQFVFEGAKRMKYARMTLIAAGALICHLAVAQPEATKNADPAAPPPIPPKVPGEEFEPTVKITDREGQRIEEYSQNGRVYMVKITPVKGPAYYYFDEDGDGQLELRESDRKLNPVQPVYWKLKEW
jgi:hypothetical protein